MGGQAVAHDLYASVQENTAVKEMIDRMNFVDRVVNQKIVLHETNVGWESSAESLEELAA